MKNFLIFFGLICLIGTASAELRVIEEHDRGWQQMWQPNTIINGALCSTYADVSKQCNSGTITCPSNIFGIGNQIKGCAVVTYDCNWYDPKETHLNPGQTQSFSGRAYEIYYCIDTSCTCDNYVDGGCGASGCPAGTMLRKRTCVNDCGEEAVCVVRTSCPGGVTTTTLCTGPNCGGGGNSTNWTLIIAGIALVAGAVMYFK